MAGSACVVTKTVGDKYIKVLLDWLSDSSAGNGTFVLDGKYSGKLKWAAFKPDSGGSAPTNLYDITITTADGLDILIGSGADLSGTTTKVVAETALGVMVDDTLTMNLSNAGNAKGGLVWLFLERG